MYMSLVHPPPSLFISHHTDMVFHSATKYLNGHSDIVAGVLCGTRKQMEQVFQGEYMTLGAAISPHDAWLMIRGLRTLAIRMERVAQTTPKIVDFLANHPSGNINFLIRERNG